MAIKPNSQQSGVQTQVDRPAVLGPLVAGVVVIKAFAGIKGEQGSAAPGFEWVPDDAQVGSARVAGYGLPIPPTIEPQANPDSGATYAGPLPYQSDRTGIEDEARDDEDSPPDLSPNWSRDGIVDDGFLLTGGSSVPALGAPVAARAAVGSRPVENAPDNILPEAVIPEASLDTDDDTSGEDAPEDGQPTAVVFGTNADDSLSTGGGVADDTLIGGGGDDLIQGHGGDDALDGRGGDDRIFGGTEDDRLLGGDGDDHLSGNAGDDQLRGEGGDDNLDGGSGTDYLFGLSGDDVLIGGLGRDELTGNLGADRFVFNEIAESSVINPDQLLDFKAYERDKIDVSSIDANSLSAQDEAFAFIEEDFFGGNAGELRFTEDHGTTYLYGDVNGDGVADFGLELLGVSSLNVDDIVL